ncbi:MAG: LysM peptidoglycan-binding domain-containing protein [Bacteroidetes bacterium]|nr:MAG: LysM peptidoglycan-binding domain-containing protein [Bacteroidota bacterium]
MRNRVNNNANNMRRNLMFIGTFLLANNSLGTEVRITKEQYVDQWSKTAVQEMFRTGIPASITLAQGILESASGNSELARKGNNHFGIKCHGWTGKKMYKDDDAKNECFRVYDDANQSYVDHSEFLKKYERYDFLFTYESDDYENWAKGLKKAGYATDPAYPQRLISIIEDLDLAKYDGSSKPQILKQPSIVAQSRIKTNSHAVTKNESLEYVVVKTGDTFYSIAKEFGLTLNQLHRYNDFDSGKDKLNVGEVVYVRRKKGRDYFKEHTYVVTQDCSLNQLAQITGVKASVIRKLNGFETENIDLEKGQKIILR